LGNYIPIVLKIIKVNLSYVSIIGFKNTFMDDYLKFKSRIYTLIIITKKYE